MVVRESVARLRRAVRFLLPEMEEEGGFVAAAPVMELREIFRRFWPYARPYRRWLPLILLLRSSGQQYQSCAKKGGVHGRDRLRQSTRSCPAEEVSHTVVKGVPEV
jgi:hypothetical protein